MSAPSSPSTPPPIRDRKGRRDRIADCQNWQDINSEGAPNEVELTETSMEVVDGREKVCTAFFIPQDLGVCILYVFDVFSYCILLFTRT